MWRSLPPSVEDEEQEAPTVQARSLGGGKEGLVGCRCERAKGGRGAHVTIAIAVMIAMSPEQVLGLAYRANVVFSKEVISTREFTHSKN